MSTAVEPLSVLVIDDDAVLAETIAESLERRGHSVTIATSGREGAARIEAEDFDVILTDLRMADLDGLAIVDRAAEKARATGTDTEIFVITGFAEVHTAVEAIKRGARHYLQKPIDLQELRAVVDRRAEDLAKMRELRRQIDEKFGFEGVVGNSPRMQRVIQQLKAFAPTSASVLILGENGTGKELAARALHFNSPRKTKPFVPMNCAALNENLLDDELFGHEAGAFTGADRLRKGRFEYAHGGTLFLDEVGDMPLPLQAKLLRVLESGEVVRIGSNEPIKVNVRVITATNKDLQEEVRAGRFRQDLYFRLKVGTVKLPPLRERREDIPLLAQHFVKDLAKRHGKPVPKVSSHVWRALEHYDWPGNVRELRNLIDCMIVLDQDGELTLDDLPDDSGIKPGLGEGKGASGSSGSDHLIGRPLEEVERYYIEKALERCHGNRLEAARMLGIGERTLYRKLNEMKKGVGVAKGDDGLS